nr:PAS domain S-box protein [Haloplanus rubicundus]
MTEPIHVLHVDDDADFAALTATFLEREDDRFVVDTATSVDAGLDRLAAGGVDCVVSDYDMDRTNGIDFLTRVRDGYGDLPFVLFTGKGSEEVASEAISAGVTDYLQKGRGTERYEILAHRISNAVEAHRSHAESETQRQRLEGILKTVPGCIVQVDTDGRFVFANERAKEVLGLERSAVTDRAYNDPEWRIRDLDGEPIPDAELPFSKVCRREAPIYGDRHTIQWPDGTEKLLRINGAPLFDGDGAFEGVVFSLTDITAERERRRTLEETERRLDLAMEATDTGVWEWYPETDTLVWDETLERVMGLDSGEFEGTYEAFADRVHPADLPTVERAAEHALETGDAYRSEFRMFHADGSVVWVEARGQVVDGRLLGIHHDITERKRREREVERTKGRLDSILENTTTPMFMKDEDGAYLFVNRRYEELFGLTEAQVVGHTDEELHPSSMAAEVRANDRQVVETGEPLTTEERIVVDGEERIFLTSKVPVHDGSDDGEPNAVFGVAKDITEREAYRSKLERQNELLEQFAGVVSHDLRSPLTVAQGRLDLASTECDSPHLDDASDALARCQELIDDLLTLARTGERTTTVEPVSLADAVEDCWQTVETGDATLDIATTRTVRADHSRLEQLLQNLVQNAVEHGSTSPRSHAPEDAVKHGSTSPRSHAPEDAVKHGSTSPRSHAPEDAVEHGSTGNQTQSDDAVEHGGSGLTITVGDLDRGFYVADDGTGFPADAYERVFEAGYSTDDEATGFGLGIVAQVAADHGWTVDVTRSEAGGARFEIRGVETA